MKHQKRYFGLPGLLRTPWKATTYFSVLRNTPDVATLTLHPRNRNHDPKNIKLHSCDFGKVHLFHFWWSSFRGKAFTMPWGSYVCVYVYSLCTFMHSWNYLAAPCGAARTAPPRLSRPTIFRRLQKVTHGFKASVR